MKIICILMDGLEAQERNEIKKILNDIKFKELDRYSTGASSPGDYRHINAGFIDSYRDILIYDSENVRKRMSKPKNNETITATMRPFGASNYFVFITDEGLEALKEEYEKQVVAVSLTKQKNGWYFIDGIDSADKVRKILDYAK